ncbi:MAG: hypothetical protein JRF33_16280 [Deltaproteobacteria bacterium]|nr:hypothetical protein [Deltaproteobacteria bacterium]
MKNTWLGAVVVLLVLIGSSVAGAKDKDAKYYQGQFERFSLLIADLKSADAADEVVRDIEVIRTHIGQAQALLAAEKLESIDPIIERIVAQAGCVRAKLDRLDAEQAAAEAGQQADDAEAAAAELKQKVDAAKKKYDALEETT